MRKDGLATVPDGDGKDLNRVERLIYHVGNASCVAPNLNQGMYFLFRGRRASVEHSVAGEEAR